MAVYDVQTTEGLILRIIATDSEVAKLITDRKIVSCKFIEDYKNGN